MAGDILTKFKASASVDGTEQLDKLVKKFEQLADSSAATNKILSKLTDISLTSSDVLERIAKSVSGLDSNFKSLNSTIASQTDRLLKQLTESAKASADSMKKAAQESKESFSGIAIGADGSSAAIIGLKGVFGDLFAKAAALKFVGAEFININRNILETQAQVDKLNNILLVKNDGQVDLVKKDLAQLEQLSERLGLRFTETATAYSKIAVAAKGSALEGKGAREVFEAVSASMAKVGVSGDGANRVFLALQQIISKGTVQTEELKGQLGEQIPGAMNIAARAVGVTTAEFAKMLEQGQVISSEFLPKFAQEMLKTFQISSTESVDTATAALNRFDNSIERVQKTLADKLSPAAREVFSGLSSALDYLNIQLKTTEFTLKGTLDLFTRVLSSIPSIPTPFGKIQVGGELIASSKEGRDRQLAELNKALTDEQERSKAGGLYNSATTSRNIEEIKSLIAEIKKIDAGLDSDGLDETLTTLIAQGRQQSENFKNLQESYKAQGNAIKGINKDYEIQIKLAKDARAAGIINDAQLTKRLAEIKQKYGEKDNSSGAVEASKRAYDGLIDRIKQVTLAEEQRAAGGDKLNAYQKLALELQVKLESEKSKLLKTDREAIGIQQIIIGFLGDEIAEKEKLAKIDEFFTKLATDKTEAAIKTIDAIEKENEALRVKILNVGADNEETAANLNLKDEARIQALEMAEALYGEADAWDSVRIAQQRELNALKDRVRLRSELGAKRDAKELADGQQKLLDQVTKELSRGITDSIFRGFEGGKKFIQSFKDAIKNAFKSLIIKFAVQPVLGSVIGGIAGSLGFTGLAQAAQKELGSVGGVGSIGGSAAGGGASGGSGFGLSDISGGKTLYDAFASGVSGIEGAFATGAEKIASAFGAGPSGLRSANAFGSTAGTYAAAAGIAYGGYSLGRGISGGYSLNGGSGNSTVNIGAIAGAFIGAGNPISIAIGSAIGSVIGGAVNKLFGSKRVLGASGIQGTFTDDGFAGRTFQDVTVKRKLRSDKSYTTFGTVDAKLLDFLADSVDSLSTSAKAAGKVLGTDISDALDKFTLSGRFSVSTQEQLKSTLDKVANAIIKQSIPALEQFKQQGENLIQTAGRISTAVFKANTSAILLGRAATFTINNAQQALGLVETIGDTLGSLDSVLASFIPASELSARRINTFTAEVEALGLASKIDFETTRQEFADLLDQIDLTSEAGQRELKTLLDLAPSLDAIIKQREAEAVATKGAEKAIADLISSVGGGPDAFDLTRKSIVNLIESSVGDNFNSTKSSLVGLIDSSSGKNFDSTKTSLISLIENSTASNFDVTKAALIKLIDASTGANFDSTKDALASLISNATATNLDSTKTALTALIGASKGDNFDSTKVSLLALINNATADNFDATKSALVKLIDSSTGTSFDSTKKSLLSLIENSTTTNFDSTKKSLVSLIENSKGTAFDSTKESLLKLINSSTTENFDATKSSLAKLIESSTGTNFDSTKKSLLSLLESATVTNLDATKKSLVALIEGSTGTTFDSTKTSLLALIENASSTNFDSTKAALAKLIETSSGTNFGTTKDALLALINGATADNFSTTKTALASLISASTGTNFGTTEDALLALIASATPTNIDSVKKAFDELSPASSLSATEIAAVKDKLDKLKDSSLLTKDAFSEADKAINSTRELLFNTTDVTTRAELEVALAKQITDRYALEMQLLGALQEGVQGVFASIGEVRGGVADARASIIGTPLQMNARQLGEQIKAVNTKLPVDALSTAAIEKVRLAESALKKSGDSVTSSTSGLKAATAAKAAEQVRIDTYNATPLEVARSSISQDYLNAFAAFNTTRANLNAQLKSYGASVSGENSQGFLNKSGSFNLSDSNYRFRVQGRDDGKSFGYTNFANGADSVNGASGKRSFAAGDGDIIVEKIRQSAVVAQSYTDAITTQSAALEKAKAEVTTNDSALKAAQTALAEAKKKFSDSIQAFVIDAGKSIAKLTKLREETIKYYEAQSALASLMGSSASGIRSTVESIRFSKLSETDQLAELQAKFATTLASAQSATGENLAGLGDKLNAQLDPLLSLAQSIYGTGTDYQQLEGVLLGQAESIAARLEDFAPKDYQDESLKLLDSIDVQISAIESATKSAETLIVDAINASRDKTLEGLRGIVSAVQGKPVTAFATGGAFTNGIVSRPTAFNSSLMGEAGPEAIMPLTNVGGKLGVKAIGSGNSEMAAEIRALRQEVSQLRKENMAGQAAIAGNTGKMSRTLDRVTQNGESITVVMEEA